MMQRKPFEQFCGEICDRVEERILTSYRPIDFREALYLLDVVGTPSYYAEKYILGLKMEMATIPIIPLVTNTILGRRYDGEAKAIKRNEYALNEFFRRFKERFDRMAKGSDVAGMECLRDEVEELLWSKSVDALSRIFGG